MHPQVLQRPRLPVGASVTFQGSILLNQVLLQLHTCIDKHLSLVIIVIILLILTNMLRYLQKMMSSSPTSHAKLLGPLGDVSSHKLHQFTTDEASSRSSTRPDVKIQPPPFMKRDDVPPFPL